MPGFDFSVQDIVQLLYLMVYKTVKIDEAKVRNDKEAPSKFRSELENARNALPDFFQTFFWDKFQLNAPWLVPLRLAMLPILAYVLQRSKNGTAVRVVNGENTELERYFLKSQILGWNTQTMVNHFANAAIAAADANLPFPLERCGEIAVTKNRSAEITRQNLEWCDRWFLLKILLPSIQYVFTGQKPEVDHIFPKSKFDNVDVIWNLQPVPYEVNNYKRAKDPREFLTTEPGCNYLAKYNFLPEINDPVWNDPPAFLEYRKGKMIEFLREHYKIDVKDAPAQ